LRPVVFCEERGRAVVVSVGAALFTEVALCTAVVLVCVTVVVPCAEALVLCTLVTVLRARLGAAALVVWVAFTFRVLLPAGVVCVVFADAWDSPVSA
jgi:hypothetical protein